MSDAQCHSGCTVLTEIHHTEQRLTNPWGGEGAFGQLKKSGINYFFSVFRAQVQCGNVSLSVRMEWSMCIPPHFTTHLIHMLNLMVQQQAGGCLSLYVQIGSSLPMSVVWLFNLSQY